MRNGANICYYADGRGRWIRREWKRQCSARVFFYGRCQGVKGHKGDHWCYSPSGDFEWYANADDPNPEHKDAVAGSTPPGNESYVSPVRMQKHYHLSHHTDTDVTDKAILAMLEKGKTPERDAGIDRPVTDKAILAMLEKRGLRNGDRRRGTAKKAS